MNKILKISALQIDAVTSFNNFFSDPSIVKHNADKILGVIQNDELLFYVVSPSHLEKLSNTNKSKSNISSEDHLFKDVANEWLFQKSKLWTPRHLNEVKRRLDKDVLPIFGNRTITSISTQEILEIIRNVEKRNRYDLSHRILRDTQSIMRYAISIGVATQNYAATLNDALIPHVAQNQKTINQDEIPDLLKKLTSYSFKEGPALNYAFQLLTLTFVRAQELMGAEWTEFDLKEKVWTIPKERMKKRKEHTVFLSQQSCLVLEKIQKDHFHPRYVFYDEARQTHIKIERLINSLYKIGYKGKMTAHGFRALASTVLNEAGFNPDVIEKQLAHVDTNSVRRAYNRAQYIVDRNKMMQWWSDFIVDRCPTFIKSDQKELNLS
jgi:integrase